MKKLIKGIIDFRRNCIADYREKFSNLAYQQTPDALLVACCDSRVVPNTFASSDPGDLFVLRNIGNLIPTYNATSVDSSVAATIEFALTNLQVADIIICGHSDCGAMQTLIKNHTTNLKNDSYIDNWLEQAESSYTRFKNNACQCDTAITPCNCLSQINVIQQLDNLKTYPSVTEYLHSNKIRLHGWWFDLEKAEVFYYNPTKKKFILIDEDEAEIILASLN
jgi:carbonic anhydrase